MLGFARPQAMLCDLGRANLQARTDHQCTVRNGQSIMIASHTRIFLPRDGACPDILRMAWIDGDEELFHKQVQRQWQLIHLLRPRSSGFLRSHHLFHECPFVALQNWQSLPRVA
jgi:hypothetical protein